MSEYIFDRPLDELDIAVFDLETTGLFPAKDAIIQIAVVPISSGEIADGGWMTLVNPGAEHLPLKPIVVDLTKITDDRLKGQPDIDKAMGEFDDRVGKRVIAGHNIRRFDIPFVERAEGRTGIDVQTDYFIDTLLLGKKLKSEKGHKLFQMADYYGIEYDINALHDALADTRLTAQVLLHEISDLKDRGVITFEDMLDFV